MLGSALLMILLMSLLLRRSFAGDLTFSLCLLCFVALTGILSIKTSELDPIALSQCRTRRNQTKRTIPAQLRLSTTLCRHHNRKMHLHRKDQEWLEDVARKPQTTTPYRPRQTRPLFRKIQPRHRHVNLNGSPTTDQRRTKPIPQPQANPVAKTKSHVFEVERETEENGLYIPSASSNLSVLRARDVLPHLRTLIQTPATRISGHQTRKPTAQNPR